MKLSQRFGLAIALLLDAAHVQWRKLTGQMGVVTKDALLLQVVGDMAGSVCVDNVAGSVCVDNVAVVASKDRGI